ncbi:MAG: 3'-5' exoribonuclease [Zoogloeaceae bacterium]|jgi:plasmid stabilization system protein ParE|nr:3'-5' exoribonuclease [Zoogloeaceae bacterium]
MSRADLMLDIETAGLQPGAAILSIGLALLVNGRYDKQGDLYLELSIEDSKRYNFVADINTVSWWLRQTEPMPLSGTLRVIEALKMLADVIRRLRDQHSDLRFWSNGAMDYQVLGAAFDRLCLPRPWNHRELRDLRTIQEMTGTKDEVLSIRPHHAQHDAVTQAKRLEQCLARTVRLPVEFPVMSTDSCDSLNTLRGFLAQIVADLDTELYTRATTMQKSLF